MDAAKLPAQDGGTVFILNLSVTFGDSSPNRGAIGKPILAVLDEESL